MNTTDSSNSNTSHATAASLEPGEGAASAPGGRGIRLK